MHFHRRLLIISFQAGLALISGYLAFLLRFDFAIPPARLDFLPLFLAISVSVKVLVYQWAGLNRGWWRYFSVSDMLTIIYAVTVAQALIYALHFLPFVPMIPRSTLLIDYFLTLLFLGGARMTMRMIYERTNLPFKSRRASDKRVLIVGAGDCGIHLLRQLQSSESERVQVVGFLDDSSSKKGASFLGHSVLGTIDQIPLIASKENVTEVLIAIPSLKKSELKRIVDLCLLAGVSFKMVPSLHDILHAGARVFDLRDVRVEDLLGREPIALDKSLVRDQIRGRRVLVTGAGGSIGSELCRQILQLQPQELVMLERSEYNLFKIEREIDESGVSASVKAIVADICDEKGLETLFQKHQPEIIFHAAAHKHVSLMEASPREAIRNNVFGTLHLARLARLHRCERFVMISTDKAVNPLSVMGYSKRMAELVVQTESQLSTKTQFISVRFGNVLGSSGSVVEIFREQLRRGQPLTVTDPHATRFFMTAPEAVELVLHAGAHGENGEIYMLDMGQPVKIMDLARRMIQLCDPTGRKEIQIKVTGLKPGEKIAEELYWEAEDSVPSSMDKVFRLRTKVNDTCIQEALKVLALAVTDSETSATTTLKSAVDKLDGYHRGKLHEVDARHAEPPAVATVH
jgi:FlaA1/EpsC-like NDP-sugar epimerase